MSAFSAAAQDEDGDTIKQLREENEQLRQSLQAANYMLVKVSRAGALHAQAAACLRETVSRWAARAERAEEMLEAIGAGGVGKQLEQPQGEQEPDWTNSETGLLECWKNPLHPMTDRLQMADGAISFRDKTIANLRLQIASYQSAQQLPTAEHSSAGQDNGCTYVPSRSQA